MTEQELRRASVYALILLAFVGALIQTGAVDLAAHVVRSAFDYVTGGTVTVETTKAAYP